MRNRLISNIYELAKKDKNIILITGDLGFGVLDNFINDLPEQYINAGIAEQNMMSVAAGLGINGKTVFVYSIGNFPTLRCIEQIRNDCCYHKANVKIICVGAGMAYGALGMSHHSTEDLAMMRSLANISIVSPASANELDLCMKQIMEPGVVYIRLGKGRETDFISKDLNYNVGDCIEINKGKDIAVFSTGTILAESVKANNFLDNSLGIYSFPIIKPINEAQVCSIINKYKRIIVLEEHSIYGGFFGLISEINAKYNLQKNIIPLGLNNEYPSIVGTQDYLRSYYHIDSQAIIELVRNKL